MSVWEYKVITSGKGGFATPALLESFLNQLGKDEWEIVHFHPQPDNALAFTGLARRSTQRDWTLEDAAAAAARAEADKLRAEFEAKFKGVASGGPASDEKPESIAAEQAASDDGFRRLRNTDSDLDPEASDEEEPDEWEKLAKEDELPTFFEAIQPLMRRNQRGAGQSVGVDHLAKKWGITEKEVIGALKECGFAVPDDEDDAPAYLEYDGDLYWVNVNRRGELWVNTKEKPRPIFRVVPGARVAPEVSADAGQAEPSGASEAESSSRQEPASEPRAGGDRPPGREGRPDRSEGRPVRNEGRGGKSAELPEGPSLLERIRPMMRRNRGGAGASGSTSFLSRALRTRESELTAAFATLGLVLPAAQGDAPAYVEIGSRTWWLNRDQRGGIWINEREGKISDQAAEPAPRPEAGATEDSAGGRERSAADARFAEREALSSETPAAPPPENGAFPQVSGTPSSSGTDSVLSAVRLLLKETRTGAVAAETGRIAEKLGKTPDELLSALVSAGLKIPEKSREKPVFVEHAGEIFWLNRNAKEQVWLNAKASKYVQPEGQSQPERKPRPSRSRKGQAQDAPSAAGEPSA